jgi:hypothetical protein
VDRELEWQTLVRCDDEYGAGCGGNRQRMLIIDMSASVTGAELASTFYVHNMNRCIKM